MATTSSLVRCSPVIIAGADVHQVGYRAWKEETLQRLFRDSSGNIKPVFESIEGMTYLNDPLDVFIILARYKFAARLIDPRDRVLDAGCGHGVGSVMLSKFASSVVGVDIDDELVSFCEESYKGLRNLRFRVGDVRGLRGLDEVFDTIVCLDVIEHFTQEEGRAVVHSLASALSDRGMLVLGTPNIRSREFASERRKKTHPFEYEYATFQELLASEFGRSFVLSMTDEVVSTSFSQMAWYFMGLGFK